MLNYNLISIDLLSTMALFITIQISKKNPQINKIGNTNFTNACYITIILLLLEIADSSIQGVKTIDLTWLLKVVDLLGFSLCPLISIVLSRVYIKNYSNKYQIILYTPLIIYEVLCFISLFNGLIFDIIPVNIYKRGILFPVIPIINILYFLILSHLSVTNISNKEENDRLFFISIFAFISLCSILQLALNNLYLIYGSISIALILYYMLLREIQFRLDPLTNVNNRLTYDRYLKKSFVMKNFAYIMFDVNNLKTINDNYGHLIGDKVLSISADIITDCFINLGRVFRIGGDEFCVVCMNVTESDIKKAINLLNNKLENVNDSVGFKFSISTGYTYVNNGNKATLNDIINKADEEMYEYKNSYKRSITVD